jgi:hypothetical protein
MKIHIPGFRGVTQWLQMIAAIEVSAFDSIANCLRNLMIERHWALRINAVVNAHDLLLYIIYIKAASLASAQVRTVARGGPIREARTGFTILSPYEERAP